MDRVSGYQSPVVPTYAKRCGFLAMGLSVIAVILPVSGILAVTPVAITLAIIALFGGLQGIAMGVLAICALHLCSSTVFWSAIDPRVIQLSLFDRSMAYFDAIGIITMCVLLFRRKS